MDRHFTSTAYIIFQNRVLLHRHPKLLKWLPPGGHLEPNETPVEAAKREAREETGLDIEILSFDLIHLRFPNAISFERPFHCLLENIPEHNGTPAHQHIDMIYLARPIDPNQKVSADFRWFSLEDTQAIQNELFPDTSEMLRHIFTICGDASLPSETSARQPLFSPAHRKK